MYSRGSDQISLAYTQEAALALQELRKLVRGVLARAGFNTSPGEALNDLPGFQGPPVELPARLPGEGVREWTARTAPELHRQIMYGGDEGL